jgi:replicative DNA helicase
MSAEIRQIELKVMATLISDVNGIIFFVENGYEINQVFSDFRDLADVIFSYFNRYKALPTPEILASVCGKKTNYSILQDQLLEVRFEEPDIEQIRYWTEQLIENNRKDVVQKTILSAAEALNSGNIDLATKTLQKGAIESDDLINRNLIKSANFKDDAKKRYDKYLFIKENPDFHKRIPTGFSSLDANINGVGPGELNIIMGRTGEGKSMFLLNIGFNAWKYHKKNVFFFSYEMYVDQVQMRLDARLARLDYAKIKNGTLGDDEAKRYKDALKTMAELKTEAEFIIIKPPQKTTVALVRNEIEKIIKTKGIKPDLIILDYLSLMDPMRTSKDQKDSDRLGEIALDCRNLGAEYQVPVWTACQTNRDGAKEKRVGSHNLFGSDQISHHSDMILALKKPDDEIGLLSDTMEVQAVKVRDGACTGFEIYYNFAFTLMTDKKDANGGSFNI